MDAVSFNSDVACWYAVCSRPHRPIKCEKKRLEGRLLQHEASSLSSELNALPTCIFISSQDEAQGTARRAAAPACLEAMGQGSRSKESHVLRVFVGRERKRERERERERDVFGTLWLCGVL